MKKAFAIASLLIVGTAITTGATAKNIYKCSGNTYSQIPCPEGVKLVQPDAPDGAHKKQADEATTRDARTADHMEKARLKQERLDLKANTPSPTKVPKTTTARAPRTAKPQDFVAEIPGTGKAKTTKRQTRQD